MPGRKNGESTGRDSNGRFSSGNAGRPRGSKNKSTRAIDALLEGEAEQLGRKAIDLALGGDIAALKLCLERICPARKDSPVSFDLPRMQSASDAAKAMRSLLRSVSKGELTPLDAGRIAPIIENFRKAVETEDLERRIIALEECR